MGRRYTVLLVLLILCIMDQFYALSNTLSYEKIYSITVYAPAVTSEEGGEGVLTKITLYIAYPGSGNVFFTANPLTELDTQATARIAAFVASSLAGVDYYSYDYYVFMESDTLVVGGPSAGALMTIGFLALFLNKTIYPNVTMTGMVYPDGMVGPVGGLKGKLEAVAGAGFKVFLIPLGERIVNVPNVTIRRYPWGVYKSITYYQLDLVEYGRSLGVDVIEVSSIREAFKYFTGYDLLCTYNSTPDLNHDLVELFHSHGINLVSEAKNYLSSTQSLVNRLDPMYRGSIGNLLNKANELINSAENYLSNGDDLVGVNKAFKATYMSLYVYWLTNALIDQDTLQDYIDLVNKTLINTSYVVNDLLDDYSNVDKIDLSKLELLIAIDMRFLDAQYSFSRAMEEINSDPAGALSDLAYSYLRTRSIDFWRKIHDLVYGGGYVAKKNVYYASMTLYSIADNVLSYAIALSRDLGTEPDLLEKAAEYMEKARSAYMENDTLAFIGELLYTLAYSTLSIYRMFSLGSSIDREMASVLSNESEYILCSLNTSSFIPTYYYMYGLEALDNHEYMDSYISFTMSILYSRLSLLLGRGKPVHMVLKRVNPYSPHGNINMFPSIIGGHDLLWLVIGIVAGSSIVLVPLAITMYRRAREKAFLNEVLGVIESYSGSANVSVKINYEQEQYNE